MTDVKVISSYQDLKGDSDEFGKVTFEGSSAIFNGFKRKCPCCGKGRVFAGYLKLQDCDLCGAPTGTMRADDFPPYLTIFLVGHILVPILVIIESKYQPDATLQMIFWPSLGVLMASLFLPYLKGFVLGFMWKMGISGTEKR